MRAEWSRKRGWYKFGTRYTVFNETSEQWGHFIPQFLEKYGDSLAEVFKKNKRYRSDQSFVAFCEHFGPSSFAGWHDYEELAREGDCVLIDINVHKRGIVLPRNFVNDFGHVGIPRVVYEGNFGKQFVQDVKDNKYDLAEGIVAKGVNPKMKREQHGLWMSKVKTAWWLQELKSRAQSDESFRKVLTENIEEQRQNDLSKQQ